MNTLSNHTETIKTIAKQLGFSFCGIAAAEQLDDDAFRLEKWLKQGMHGSMTYMENYFDKRINPKLLVPDAKSIITLMFNYYPHQKQQTDGPKISKYAYGDDYHEVIKSKLQEFLFVIHEKIGAVSGRGFVDSAPVLERAWAVKTGLGWIGKNGNLINKHQGSFFFIATLIVDLKLNYDTPFNKDYCGTCTACIDACPTEAILPNKTVIGNKCISYYTIELKEATIPSENKFADWMFGCDTCQDVCPWNRFSKPHNTTSFNANELIINFNTRDWLQINEANFKTIFQNSPLKRSKWKGIMRNLKFILDK
jgi:epoxyqueuosine reductase